MPFPVEDILIAAAEKALGRRLPDGLRERLRRTATNNIVHETEEARDAFKELFPDGAVVLANDGGGDYLLLLPGENEPRWWEPRTGELEPAPNRLVAGVRGRGTARRVALLANPRRGAPSRSQRVQSDATDARPGRGASARPSRSFPSVCIGRARAFPSVASRSPRNGPLRVVADICDSLA